ncbi:UDP-glucose--glucosyl LPS a 1, 2-glucosyltransferase [Salmonella enterica]|uniref:UDP-glucose--glucosyl LPS a 1, 2-glucosyltransferase n=1 Tax=Salmonella enterica subsp. VII serovar 40:z4,z24:[z39] TaxID=1967625 RepID=A0A731TQ56_SALEE|nr:UDP-glucose--glucosyl LPS a 1, 2-glucosyltransferase [Salmonella enterica]EDO5297409.1 UDP-glucose--glucosyl LPS a 1, 2-glucosyltransferase [Salmonella enterica subsp. houtenae serovar 40:z4,z24:-]QUZ23673.1 UDP-glucose--glucosyl LPS a 1, 2-glucosyltransferase [Salmonella enterica subsp. VII str. CFSAN000554]HAE4732395.1 UDP-glucose--glucosyl LPS a 1, 2-glucosyltransferase [Salmonella enterica subsp. VII serovar 40:z4,z24:[z39]]HBZ8551049.1 UDP-glucose--glucosyl LPS a 1, 2-glucosyltransferas
MFLFICMTNLQLLIARSIIEKEQLKSVDVLFIGDVDNVKNLYYLKKIQPLCRHSSIVSQISKFSTFKTIKRTQYAKKIMAAYAREYHTVFFANFHVPLIHHILSCISFSEIKTFDDGTNNINQKSIMYEGKNIRKISKLIRKLMGRKYHKEEILKLDVKHYTLFPNRSNIIKNTEEIVLGYHISLPDTNNELKKILLGTVYTDALKNKEDEDIFLKHLQSFLKKKEINIYIPHPRYDSHQFNGVLNINSEMIAEDIILEYLEQGMVLELYGFNSTVQYTLNNISAVKSYKITSPLLKDSFNYGLDFDFSQVSV